MGDEEGQTDPEGLQDLHLLDDLLARGQQDAQCAPRKRQKDGCRKVAGMEDLGRSGVELPRRPGRPCPSVRLFCSWVLDAIYFSTGNYNHASWCVELMADLLPGMGECIVHVA
jgi:hypothetical protein